MEQQKACDKCLGEGYIEVADSILPQETDWIVCHNCDGSGAVELEASDIF